MALAFLTPDDEGQARTLEELAGIYGRLRVRPVCVLRVECLATTGTGDPLGVYYLLPGGQRWAVNPNQEDPDDDDDDDEGPAHRGALAPVARADAARA